jgi:hypothetical protein
MEHDYIARFDPYKQMKEGMNIEWKTNHEYSASYAGSRKKRESQDYRTPAVSSGIFRLSKRLRSCSRANVSEGVVFAASGGMAAEGAADEECFFAATEAGTKDIMETPGFFAEAGAPVGPARPVLIPGPPAWFLAGWESERGGCTGLPGILLRLFGDSR